MNPHNHLHFHKLGEPFTVEYVEELSIGKFVMFRLQQANFFSEYFFPAECKEEVLTIIDMFKKIREKLDAADKA